MVYHNPLFKPEAEMVYNNPLFESQKVDDDVAEVCSEKSIGDGDEIRDLWNKTRVWFDTFDFRKDVEGDMDKDMDNHILPHDVDMAKADGDTDVVAKELEEMKKRLKEMEDKAASLRDVQPNHVTFVALLPVCQHLETLQGIHEQILWRGFQYNLFMGNGLVHMYAKMGAIGVARQALTKWQNRACCLGRRWWPHMGEWIWRRR